MRDAHRCMDQWTRGPLLNLRNLLLYAIEGIDMEIPSGLPAALAEVLLRYRINSVEVNVQHTAWYALHTSLVWSRHKRKINTQTLLHVAPVGYC